MESISRNVGDSQKGNRETPTEQYLNLSIVLKSLLDMGFITLPTMSAHFRNAIMSALAGDTFPIKQALGKLVPYADKIIDLETESDYIKKWRTNCFDNVFVTYRVVMFFYVIVTEADKELQHAHSEHKKSERSKQDMESSRNTSKKKTNNKGHSSKRNKTKPAN